MFPLEKIKQIKARPQDFRLLKQVPLIREKVIASLPLSITPMQANERVYSLVFLDIETTGLSSDAKIIELGMVHCTFSMDRYIILSVNRYLSGFEDPQEPIPAKIVELTGITNEMVHGQSFDNNEVQNFFTDRPLVVAHNAKFDRPHFEQRFPQLINFSWACSLQGINWDSLGFAIHKLEFIMKSIGFFYNAHRAIDDCFALCFLLIHNQKAMQMLINSALQVSYKIEARYSPFSIKDTLKKHDYRWDPNNKVWYIEVNSQAEVDAQVQFLRKLYDRDEKKLQVISYTAKTRFRE